VKKVRSHANEPSVASMHQGNLLEAVHFGGSNGSLNRDNKVHA
jgi:hypothetical protein